MLKIYFPGKFCETWHKLKCWLASITAQAGESEEEKVWVKKRERVKDGEFQDSFCYTMSYWVSCTLQVFEALLCAYEKDELSESWGGIDRALFLPLLPAEAKTGSQYRQSQDKGTFNYECEKEAKWILVGAIWREVRWQTDILSLRHTSIRLHVQ